MTSPCQLNLRHLRAFLAVSDLGSTLAASSAVHLSQPAVTQAIGRLEEHLAVRLFDRHSAGMIETEAGALFAGRARRALAFIERGAAAAGTGGRRRSGSGFDRLVTTAQLRALIAVADSGNFSLAARATGVSQPSLHRLARDLERLSGAELFRKSSSGIALTDGAAELARFARLAFAELRYGFEDLDRIGGMKRASLSIGALPLMRTAILPRAIAAMSRSRPEVRFRVVDGPYDDLLHALRNGEIDILLGALRDPVPIDDVAQTALFLDRLSVIARAGHPLGGKRRISVADLARFPWIASRPGAPGRTQFDRLFAEARLVAPAGLVEASSLVVVRGLLIESDRLTLLSRHQVEPELRHGMLEILPFDPGDAARPIGMTVRRDWQPTAAQSEFVEQLEAVCAESAIASPAIRKANS